MITNRHIAQLAKSQRGKHCLKGLEVFLEEHCHSLDLQNQFALVELIREFTDAPSATVEAIREGITQ